MQEKKGERGSAQPRFARGIVITSLSALLCTLARAGGPVPPELTGFAPLDQQDLVDHFTGGFRYSVPIFEVPGPNGGYPIVLTYASGITPDQDASWVGLGWTLSPGAIVRQMRGVPDDFSPDSDTITTVRDIEPQRTYGLTLAGNYEFFGVDSSVGTGIDFGLTGYFDNYRGFGINNTVGLSAQVKSGGMSESVGLNIGEDTLEGAHVAANASLSLQDAVSFGANLSYDAGRGLPALSFSAQASYQQSHFLLGTSGNLFNYLGYAKPAALPATANETNGGNISITFKAGGEVFGNYINGRIGGFYNFENIRNSQPQPTPAVGYLHLEEAIRASDQTEPNWQTKRAADDDLTQHFALDFNREGDGPIYDQSPNLAVPILTHDIFVVSGRDLTGAFRAYRNDTPVVFDPKQNSELVGGTIGVDVGFGDVVKVGVSGDLSDSKTTVGRWNGGATGVDGHPDEVQTLLGRIKRSFVDDPTGALERTYFKFIGEPSVGSGNAAAEQPMAPQLVGNVLTSATPLQVLQANGVMPPLNFLASDQDAQHGPWIPQQPAQRVPRATLIQAFTNRELTTLSRALPELAAAVTLASSDPTTRGTRESHPNHIGAFRITAPNGTRYVYGLAVYNTDYQEHKFSVNRKTVCPATGYCTIVKPPLATPAERTLGAAYDYRVPGSEQMLEIKEVSPYVSSYLMTAILGRDYIDSDGIPGPSDGDTGYWVKFNYTLDRPDMGWRTPYLGASFVRGPDNGRFVVDTERLHDKAYFTYGKRESWYLSSIETATHKAFFCVSRQSRRDALGATSIDQSQAPNGPAPWALIRVELYTKAQLRGLQMDPQTNCPISRSPLVGAHLQYENYDTGSQPASKLSLANHAPNAPLGKLTLRRIYFTHLGSLRGSLSPYTFDYGATDPAQNPDYQNGFRDRWDTFQQPPTPPSGGVNPAPPPAIPALEDRMAWTDQTSPGHSDQNTTANPLDTWAGAWSLRTIREPTGRVLKIQYESGDYAYVQDRPAMRFFAITSVNADPNPTPSSKANVVCPAVVGSGGVVATAAVLLPTAFPFGVPPGGANLLDCAVSGAAVTPPRIYFALECDDQGAHCDTNINDYVDLDDHAQVFFKARMALKLDDSGLPAKWQTISGYANVKAAGTDGTSRGWLDLAPVHSDYPTSIDYHPLAHAAWQYLRLQQPELTHDGGLNGDPDGDPLKEALNVLTLVDAIPDLIQSLSGMYPGWLFKGWGQNVDLNNAWVRLKDPNGIKKGGGGRVRELAVSDGWSHSTGGREADLTTGYHYTYRLPDGRSSGVAAYEPMVGAEENPLRQAKPFVDQVLLSSDYNLFAQLPLAESLYPGPAVGYSRVVRESLASRADIQDPTRDHPTSAGPTVYEFYTARDFPVRSQETLISKERLPFPQVVNIPLLGTITLSSLTTSQGYLTTLNDMHGKPKAVTSYQYADHQTTGGNPRNDVLLENPVKQTSYTYHSVGGVAGTSSSLDNRQLPTLSADPGPVAGNDPTVKQPLGRESDFVVDLRQNRTESFEGGISLNVDTFLIAYVSVPIPVPVPNFGYSLTETKSVVTHRVVHEGGIVDSIIRRDGAAQITTHNDAFDPLTGRTLLREGENPYGQPIFEYEMPARWTYPRMGPAYPDVGRRIDLSGGLLDAVAKTLTVTAAVVRVCPDTTTGTAGPGCLPLGSELGEATSEGGLLYTLVSGDSTHSVFNVEGEPASPIQPGIAVVVRSGNRNILTEATDTFRSLANPLEARKNKSCLRPRNFSTEPGSSQFLACPRPGAQIGPGAVSISSTHLEGILEAHHTSFLDAWPDYTAAPGTVSSGPNDYASGRRGIFRPLASYVFRADRSSSAADSATRGPVDTARDGTFEAALFGPNVQPVCSGWIPTVSHTHYSRSGFDLEDYNALGICSAAEYGDRETLPFAVAVNATQAEIGFEGFETNQGTAPGSRSGETNIDFSESIRCVIESRTGCVREAAVVSIVTDHAHTGKRSLKLLADTTFSQTRLGLQPGRNYFVSAWVYLGSAEVTPGTHHLPVSTPQQAGLQISYVPAGATAPQVLATWFPSGPIIDGWQRLEGVFTAPVAPGSNRVPGLALTFLNHGGTSAAVLPARAAAYFDDVRIQPEDSQLQAYVYDPDTRRMTAMLDENNFATFYRYALDGTVDLVRRETVRGIFAEQEARLHSQEQP